jgi:MoaA/NifB/PqqE/SkfB family radical SAM enzyme
MDMPIKTYKKIAKFFIHTQNIYLSGWGEPLSNIHFIKMISLAKEAGCSVGFTTNASLLNEDNMKKLVDLEADLMSISVAGGLAETHESKRRGSNLKEIFTKINQLNKLKKRIGSEKPHVFLLFMMFKDNLEELSYLLENAAKIGTSGVIATNLDYIGMPDQDDLKAFSCEAPNNEFTEKIIRTEELAQKLDVYFKAFPLQLSCVQVCSEDPINNLYISEAGHVSPCVYLSIPMKKIPRLFCGKRTILPKINFGNVNEKSLIDIWKSDEFTLFRKKFETRLEKNDYDPASLPDVCKTCYKAYGV